MPKTTDNSKPVSQITWVFASAQEANKFKSTGSMFIRRKVSHSQSTSRNPPLISELETGYAKKIWHYRMTNEVPKVPIINLCTINTMKYTQVNNIPQATERKRTVYSILNLSYNWSCSHQSITLKKQYIMVFSSCVFSLLKRI